MGALDVAAKIGKWVVPNRSKTLVDRPSVHLWWEKPGSSGAMAVQRSPRPVFDLPTALQHGHGPRSRAPGRVPVRIRQVSRAMASGTLRSCGSATRCQMAYLGPTDPGGWDDMEGGEVGRWDMEGGEVGGEGRGNKKTPTLANYF